MDTDHLLIISAKEKYFEELGNILKIIIEGGAWWFSWVPSTSFQDIHIHLSSDLLNTKDSKDEDAKMWWTRMGTSLF